MCDEPKGGGWIPREWEGVGTELGEAGRPYHVRLHVVGSLRVCYGEWSVCRRGEVVRVAAVIVQAGRDGGLGQLQTEPRVLILGVPSRHLSSVY